MKPDPTRIYVSTRSYSSPASIEHLGPSGVVRPGMKLRGDHPIVIERPDAWIDAAEDPNTLALVQALRGVVTPDRADALPPAPARRKPGRPGWTAATYRAHWRKAIARGGLREDALLADVAQHFELLDETIGADPAYLRRLDVKLRRDETPE